MLKSLRAVARFFQNTIGWNRIGVLLSIAIIRGEFQQAVATTRHSTGAGRYLTRRDRHMKRCLRYWGYTEKTRAFRST